MPQERPLMLGVVGDSAAGKTTLTQGLAALMGVEDAILVCTDDYHRCDRATRRQLDLTALHPDCNYLDIVAQHLTLLRRGQAVLKPVYDHRTGTFQAPEYIKPGNFVIVEGLLALSTAPMQRCFDVTIYLDPEETLRRRWKISRDTAERGYTTAEVEAAIERRKADSRVFIWPQKEVADLIVQFYRPAGEPARAQAQLSVRLMQRHTLSGPDLTDLLAKSNNGGPPVVRLQRDVWNGHWPVDILEIDGSITPTQAATMEEVLWAHLTRSGYQRPDLVGGYKTGANRHHSVTLALTQLLIAYYLLTIRAHWPVGLV
ncbi:MAG TPA: phosphoribulokinase [Anaerolineae bacterium]|nr:phosphoribulokinase [Anaerolineae bacterium]HMR63826.1 phosphoribulokinase [Anaerolineae bacterium]